MGSENNEFTNNLNDASTSRLEEALSKKLFTEATNLKNKTLLDSVNYKIDAGTAFKGLQRSRKLLDFSKLLGKSPISNLNLFANIKDDFAKTKNLTYSIIKNITSGAAGKAAGTAATAAIAIPTGGIDAPLAIAGGIATDAAVSTGVNKTFDYGYQNRGKISSQWQKFLNDSKNNNKLYNYSKNSSANLGTSNQPVAGVANNTQVVDNTQVIVTQPQSGSSNGSNWLSDLGSALSGVASLLSTGVNIIGGVLGGATKNVSAEIVSHHTGGIVVPKYKGGRNEMLAVLQGGETVRTEAQEKELQDAKTKELLAAYAPLVSGESADTDPYAQVFGASKSNKKDTKTPILMNKTRDDEDMIIAIAA